MNAIIKKVIETQSPTADLFTSYENISNILAILICWAKRMEVNHTYAELIKALGQQGGNSSIGHYLGRYNDVLAELSRQEDDIYIPKISSICKKGKKMLPSDGFVYNVPGYEEMSEAEKRELIRCLDLKVILFQNWDWVLKKLDLVNLEAYYQTIL